MGMGLITREQLIEMMLDDSDPYAMEYCGGWISHRDLLHNDVFDEPGEDEQEYCNEYAEPLADNEREEDDEEWFDEQERLKEEDVEYNERLSDIRSQYGYGTDIVYGEDLDEAEARCEEDEYYQYYLF